MRSLYLKTNISHKSVHFLHDTFVIAAGHVLYLNTERYHVSFFSDDLNHRFVDYHCKMLRRTYTALVATEFCS